MTRAVFADPFALASWATRTPLRRWVLERAVRGTFDTRDVTREFPTAHVGDLAEMVDAGLLRVVARSGGGRHARNTYALANLSDLRAAHAWLGQVLAVHDGRDA